MHYPCMHKSLRLIDKQSMAVSQSDSSSDCAAYQATRVTQWNGPPVRQDQSDIDQNYMYICISTGGTSMTASVYNADRILP